MTGNEKTTIADFFNVTLDYLSGGFRTSHEALIFGDDLPREKAESPAALGETWQDRPAESPTAHDREDETENRKELLEKLNAEVNSCSRCGLCSTRINAVPGEGVLFPLVMVIGEGPGEEEDKSGRPFVGRAGQLLDRMLDSRGKIGLSRTANCYIANVLKCRPPGNRSPAQDEITSCAPYLLRQITILRPKIILAAGNTAAKTLLDSIEGITKLRGIFTHFRGNLLMEGDFNIPLLPTFHPSALLRDETLKGPVWEDLKKLRAKLCELDGEYAGKMADNPL